MKLTQGELIDLDEAAEAVLREVWSDAARAAAVAARQARAKGARGREWRKTGRKAFLDASPASQRSSLAAGHPAGADTTKQRALSGTMKAATKKAVRWGKQALSRGMSDATARSEARMALNSQTARRKHLRAKRFAA